MSTIKILLISVLLVIVSGCGTVSHYEKVVDTNHVTEWDVYNAEIISRTLRVKSLESSVLTIQAEELVRMKERTQKVEMVETRWNKDPDFFNLMLAPLLFFVPCMDDGCFGYSDRYYGDAEKRYGNFTSTGQIKTTARPLNGAQTTNIVIVGFDEQGNNLGSVNKDIELTDSFEIDLASLDDISKQPHKLSVVINWSGAETLSVELGPGEIAKLKFSDYWLKGPKLIDAMMDKIYVSLSNQQYKQALKPFAKLESLGNDYPSVFYFYYIDTLLRDSQKTKAANIARQYLNKFSASDEYYSQIMSMTNIQN